MSDDPASAEAFRWELEQAIERLKKTRDALTEERDELVRISNKLTRERDEARWEVCGFHHLTGFLAGDYAISRGWNYFNDERKWPKFPQSVTDFQEFLRGQDKIFLESNDRLRKENEQLRKERDEARRMLCEEWAKQDGLPLDWQGRRGAEGMAEFVKWDCFKEYTNV